MDRQQPAVPRHVCIIMDGNGRWAKMHGRPRAEGHARGAASLRACMEAASQVEGLEYLSVFAFSEENWHRPEQEVSAIMDMMLRQIHEELPDFLENKVRFRVVGNRARLPQLLNEAIDGLEQATAHFTGHTLVVFVSYSGQWDIVQAAARAARSCTAAELDALTPAQFARYLATDGIPDPDLLIRTSGELRISNFMLWQTAYTEFYFTDTLWPDFGKEDFRLALSQYARRDRRYGRRDQSESE